MDIKQRIFLVLILVISGFLRFFNLMHDSPYFFNPDERNMANAISQLRLPSDLSQIPICLISQFSQLPTNCNLNPHFFSYGQFPLYLAFISDQIIRAPLAVLQGVPLQTSLQTSFSSAIFWLRFWSALSSTLTVLLVFLISRKLFALRFSLFAAAAAAFTPGLIQSAHFGTTESLLTFFFLLSVYISLSYLSHLSHLKFVIFTSLTIGLSLGSKLTGIFFFVPPMIALIIQIIEVLRKKGKKKIYKLFVYLFICLLVFIGSITTFVVASPYNLVEPENFKSAVFGYEQDVATGKYEAFYTRQFVNTTPIIFQAEKIFPYALGWPVFILGTLGFLLMNFQLIQYLILPILRKYQISNIKYQINKLKTKNIFNILYVFFIFDLSFLIYLIPNAFLFAKWTRFMTPVFPFFSIFAVYAIFLFYKIISGLVAKYQRSKIKYQIYISKIIKSKIFNILYVFFIFNILYLILLPGIAFMSIYTHEDSRLTASKWIYQNIPNGSYVLSETANVVDIPLGLPNNLNTATKNYEVISFDFYHLDENPTLFRNLLMHLEKANYIFIPSRRIFANYTKLPQIYPLVTKYYQLLNSSALGFEKISEFSSLPDENAEETFTVFDHPVVRIYRKIKPMTLEEYKNLFTLNYNNEK